VRLAFLSIGRHLHTERWIRWFAERGHECHLLTVQPGPVEGVTVHDIRRDAPAKALRYLRSLGVVRSILDDLQPDLLNTHFLTGYGYWGDFSGFRPNVLSVWGDDVYVTPHENPLKLHLARRALRNADAVTGDSKDILRACAGLGADPDRCFEVLWGVDFSVFRPDRETQVRQRLGIPAEAPVFFSPRSFTQPYYNLDIIIDACRQVRERRPDVHVVFAGYEGDQGPFVEQARAAGLDQNTHFVGRIPHEEFADYLVATDVFISVPSIDATAVSLLEAMSCRTAIVVSSLASSMEWIEDGVTGRVVPPRDADSLAAALTDFVEQPGLRNRCGSAAMELARARASSDDNFWKAEQIYRWLVEGRMLHESVRGIGAEV
jgi:glycosyltransferase involved in cell wall biosynthesis